MTSENLAAPVSWEWRETMYRDGMPAGRGTPQGYGTDPNVVTPHTPWPRTLSEHERALIAVLGDIILPGTADHPAPSAMGIADFIDDWVSAPYKPHPAHRTVIKDGLAIVDDESRRRFGAGFLDLDDARRREIVHFIASPAAAVRWAFFVRLRYLVVGGYFTSDAGFPAIGYHGNVPLLAFPGVSPEARSIIDDELRKLGL
ncbi:gluconate 2-dehydrogenase subunit 3 family protein [Nonomuraea sp. K274]|uniref:Gluconate 2-dehydrogenase subunit 3 family protein n=1 Tax=Nonomuraea cypriaca TaxID=1187855 RepID=A0A931A5B0_9ACTN|nr:gluconate 2-dehydrogenase subunit 3 family protein [Nonomuraea cypriaca]MBF8185280.1 gluconate 2-dehydrogenase subunit 3 family protein [Nonomuraea cypriaca]